MQCSGWQAATGLGAASRQSPPPPHAVPVTPTDAQAMPPCALLVCHPPPVAPCCPCVVTPDSEWQALPARPVRIAVSGRVASWVVCWRRCATSCRPSQYKTPHHLAGQQRAVPSHLSCRRRPVLLRSLLLGCCVGFVAQGSSCSWVSSIALQTGAPGLGCVLSNDRVSVWLLWSGWHACTSLLPSDDAVCGAIAAVCAVDVDGAEPLPWYTYWPCLLPLLLSPWCTLGHPLLCDTQDAPGSCRLVIRARQHIMAVHHCRPFRMHSCKGCLRQHGGGSS